MVQGASADGARTVFRADAALTPGACADKGIFQVYESVGGGVLRLISARPNGTPVCAHSSAGTLQANLAEFREDSVFNAVSDDGRRVYWMASESKVPVKNGGAVGSDPGKLFLRINADQAQSKTSGSNCTEAEKACTLRVSELVTVDQPAQFWGAAEDGATAIFSIEGSSDLTENPNYRGLFEYSATTKAATLIAKGLVGVMGMSEDAERIYFASTEVLTGTEENSQGKQAEAGKANLYFYERGSAMRFVAGLSALDVAGAGADGTVPSPVTETPKRRTSRVSPNGLAAAFTSTSSLTGYDNTDISSGEVDSEVYLYDAEGGEGAGMLLCASCNPSGARPRGRPVVAGTSFWAAAGIPGWTFQQRPGGALAADGSRLFFNSFDSLTLADTNGRQDVYQWEAPGSGSCTESSAAYSPQNEGCVDLISSGQSPEDSELLDATASGEDVFFTTLSSLRPEDPGLIDVYDARVDGGYPLPVPPKPICEGEACQSPPPPPNDPTPASPGFQGAGNVKPGPWKCPKGKHRVKRAGKSRCVKNKPAKTKQNGKAGKGRVGR